MEINLILAIGLMIAALAIGVAIGFILRKMGAENIRPYKGKHPAEKPVKMLEHAILATTYEGDIVLDCFAGSGSTAVAALKNNRRSVSIEIDEQWTEQITALLQQLDGISSSDYPDNYHEALLQSPPDQMAFNL